MKKEFNQMVKAIEVTKRYDPAEVKKLSLTFRKFPKPQSHLVGEGKESFTVQKKLISSSP